MKIFGKLFLVLLGLTVGLLIAEFILQLIPKFKLSAYIHKDRDVWGGQELRLHNELGWEIIPNYTGGSRKINSLGMVDKEYPIKKPDNTYRILIIGDSVTGSGFYSEYFENMLNHNSSKINFEVWNCGIRGYNLDQYYTYIKTRVINYEPDCIIVGFCLHDLKEYPLVIVKEKDTLKFYTLKGPIRNKFILNNFLINNSAIYRILYFKINKTLDNFEKRGNELIYLINKICKKEKVKLYFLIFPYLKPQYSKPELREYNTIKRLLNKFDINYIDYHEYMPDNIRYSLRIEEASHVHFNKKGDEIIAEVLYNRLKKAFVLKNN